MKPPYKAKAGGRREERLHKGDARSRLCPLGRTFFNSKIPRKDVGGGCRRQLLVGPCARIRARLCLLWVLISVSVRPAVFVTF